MKVIDAIGVRRLFFLRQGPAAEARRGAGDRGAFPVR